MAGGSDDVDANQETVRLLRSQLRTKSSLKVIEIPQSSILAALYPDHTDYLYFVARSDGTHIFSKSFEEHQHAIAELRKAADHTGPPRG